MLVDNIILCIVYKKLIEFILKNRTDLQLLTTSDSWLFVIAN